MIRALEVEVLLRGKKERTVAVCDGLCARGDEEDMIDEGLCASGDEDAIDDGLCACGDEDATDDGLCAPPPPSVARTRRC